MKYGINLNVVLPLRADASERSEMISQLLFGEFVQILDEKESFFQLKNQIDDYCGWVDKKMVTVITQSKFNLLQTQDVFRVCVPIADVFCLSNKTIFRLSAGSLLPNYNPDNSKFGIGEIEFQIHPSFVTYLPSANNEGIVPTAMHFLNTSYLWGGKSIMGIECSGFVQVVYAMNGIKISRDASTQAEEGISISQSDINKGDLMFFEKKGHITHVGIYMGDNKIIHASGSVKIDFFDNEGIYVEGDNKQRIYTHKLALIKSFRTL